MTHLIATVFGVGLLKPAPGTWGSAAAIPAAWGLHAAFGFPGLAVATGVAFLAGWWATRAVTARIGRADPSEIVVDELVGMWLALWPLSFGLWQAGAAPGTFPWPGWVAGFLLFRLFDIWKPGPIGWADRMKTPLGVMLDDVIAGVAAAIGVAALAAIAHGGLRL
ncbi:MAG: phosphatidylglycerophosphatase A [Pseudomonadota bacterium]